MNILSKEDYLEKVKYFTKSFAFGICTFENGGIIPKLPKEHIDELEKLNKDNLILKYIIKEKNNIPKGTYYVSKELSNIEYYNIFEDDFDANVLSLFQLYSGETIYNGYTLETIPENLKEIYNNWLNINKYKLEKLYSI